MCVANVKSLASIEYLLNPAVFSYDRKKFKNILSFHWQIVKNFI